MTKINSELINENSSSKSMFEFEQMLSSNVRIKSVHYRFRD
jgi:hypothetical protein